MSKPVQPESENNSDSSLVSARGLKPRVGYSVCTICRMARAGEIPSVRRGRSVRFDPVEVIATLKARYGVNAIGSGK
jgi:predicted DNA-binding transcriptional regulator AlpA